MKITLKFDATEDGTEEGRAIRAMKADSYLSLLWDLKSELREWWKRDKDPTQTLESLNELVNQIDFDADGWQ